MGIHTRTHRGVMCLGRVMGMANTGRGRVGKRLRLMLRSGYRLIYTKEKEFTVLVDRDLNLSVLVQ